jgi:cell division septation protein DedD
MNKPFSYQSKLICYIGAIMAKNIDKVIREADGLIKQERFAEAWDLLLPYKADENARKRLKWLKAKQQQLQIENDIAIAGEKPAFNTWGWFNGLGCRMQVAFVAISFCIGSFMCYQFQVTFGFIPDSAERTQTAVAQSEIRATGLVENITVLPPDNDPSDEDEENSDNQSSSEQGIVLKHQGATFVVQQIQFLSDPDGYSLRNAAALSLLGYIQNDDESRQCVSGNEVRLILDGQEYRPESGLMDAMQNVFEPSRDYLGTFAGQCIEGNSQDDTFVAFDVPRSAQEIFIRFGDDEQALGFNLDAVSRSEGFILPVSGAYAPSSVAETSFVDTPVTESVNTSQSATAIPSLTPTFTATITATSSAIPPTATATITNTPAPTQTLPPTALPTSAPLPSGTTYYANLGDVKVRACPQTSCEQLTVLQFGEAIQVIGETTGDSAYGSTRWYEVNWNGRRAYVHSELLSSQRPVPTSAPVINSNSVQNPPVSQQQWSCSVDYNCSDFNNSCEQARSYFNACPGDPSGLDNDNDGIPCDSICGG